MKPVILNDMEKLLPPVEQAQLIGLIKTPESMQQEEKQKYLLNGVLIACAVLTGGFIILHIVEQNKAKKEHQLLY